MGVDAQAFHASGWQARRLSAEQYDALMQSSGKPAKMYLDQQVQTPVWRSMEYDHRAGFIKQTMEDFHAAGRGGVEAALP
jgi:hypothetical protein